MWFVVHVKPGCESQAVGLLRQSPGADGLGEVFCPMAEFQRSEYGELVDDLRPMMSGCVFVVAPGKRELRACLRRADGLDALYAQQPCFEALASGEESFVNLWAEPGERVCELSDGWIDKAGNLTLEAGPLYERQDDIQKLSGDRRKAYLGASVAGRPVRAAAGVRITRNDHLHPWER